MAERVTPQSVDFSRWYTDVVQQAGLADYAPVRGCMVIKPYGYALWENIQRALDDMFKATGHQNAYFPLFIPKSFLDREAEHVEGFAPEVAVVTYAGGAELEEPLIIRPTSETIIGEMFSRWIQSYRDLPMLINQWCNVVRWEMRTRLFLRTSEFLWQEGHTAHATHEEAREEQARMLECYRTLAEDWAAVPVHGGEKTPAERFAGALSSLSIEALMRDGKALQSGTSHDLGQNFARAFNISYQGEDGQLHLPWQTSWGASTRLVGMIVMAHGDETGLLLPPRLAPYQVVIVPIQRTDYAGDVSGEARTLAEELRAAGVRVHVDDRDLSPGYRFTDWEVRGVPLRVELGPRDVDARQVTVSRRDKPGKAGKTAISREGAVTALRGLLDQVQASLFARAAAFRDEHTFEPKTDAELYERLEESAGFARVPVAVTEEMEATLKDRGKAAVRVLVPDGDVSGERCIVTGAPATDEALIARAY